MWHGGIGGWKPLAKRIFFSLLSIILVLVLIASVNFAIFRAYGDGAWILPRNNEVLEVVIQEELKLGEPLVVRYFDYLARTFTGDFYTSTGVRQLTDVESLIYHNVLGTIFLLVIVSTGSVLLGMAWGSRMRKNSGNAYGRFLHVLAVSSLSFPVFYLGLSLLIAASHLDIGFPIGGNGFDEGVVGVLQHAILPILSLTVAGSGFFALVARAGLLRAERLGDGTRPFRALDYVDPFPYFLFPLVMIGALSVDLVYSYDGLGTLVWDAILSQDVNVLMACFFVISAIVFFSQLVFRAVREKNRFMEPIDGILGPLGETKSHSTLDLRFGPRRRLSVALVVSESKKVAGAYMRRKYGVAAGLIFALILALGLFAAVLSTVPDPLSYLNHEPNLRSEDGTWLQRNPLPPSFSPSEYLGLVHPLGTDHVGRDLYSMNLYAAGAGIVVVLTTCAISVFCGLFVGFLSIVSAHYTGLLSRLRRYSMAIVSLSFLAILAPLIPICILMTPYRNQTLPIEVLLILPVYFWVYRAITSPISDLLRSVRGDRRWSEAGKILRDSMRLFRCCSPLVLGRTLHVTKYIVVLMIVFSSSYWIFWPFHFGFALDWNHLLGDAYSYGGFYLSCWWWIVPPLVGIVALAASSYFCIDTLERVFDERIEFHEALKQAGEEAPGSDSGVTDGQDGAEREVPKSTTESSE
jgi:peptide/nickel transport system permease protein